MSTFSWKSKFIEVPSGNWRLNRRKRKPWVGVLPELHQSQLFSHILETESGDVCHNLAYCPQISCCASYIQATYFFAASNLPWPCCSQTINGNPFCCLWKLNELESDHTLFAGWQSGSEDGVWRCSLLLHLRTSHSRLDSCSSSHCLLCLSSLFKDG